MHASRRFQHRTGPVDRRQIRPNTTYYITIDHRIINRERVIDCPNNCLTQAYSPVNRQPGQPSMRRQREPDVYLDTLCHVLQRTTSGVSVVQPIPKLHLSVVQE